jgi:hypothetical protein
MSAKPVIHKETTFEFFKRKWIAITAVFITICSIFGLGYAFGQYSNRMDFKIEKIELQNECDRKLQAEINRCRDAELQKNGKALEELKIVLTEISKNKK